MIVSGMVVEIEEGGGEAVLPALSQIRNVSVYGVKDNRIVSVIEGRDEKEIEETFRTICSFEKVTGVYPVFAGRDA